MIKKYDKNADRVKRHQRVRSKISGTAETPRMNVYRSLSHIYVQIIDDVAGITLVSCSTKEKAVAELIQDKTKKEQSKFVGEQVAKKALEKGITKVVFDRGGYLYTGRVSAVADGARAAGLKF